MVLRFNDFFDIFFNIACALSSLINIIFLIFWILVAGIDIEVSRLTIVCPGLFNIVILFYSPRPKPG